MNVLRSTVPNAAQRCIRVSLSITPLRGTDEDLAGLLGNLFFDFLQLMGVSRQISSKVNVQIIELTTHLLEHSVLFPGALKLDFAMTGDEVTVDVSDPMASDGDDVATRQFHLVSSAEDPKRLLADMVLERRIDRAKGGLGLMRLTEESKMRLSGDHKKRGGGSGSDGGEGSSAPALVLALPLKRSK